MLVKKLREELKRSLEGFWGEDGYYKYLEKHEDEKSDLDRIDLSYHSHAGSRDGDYFVITKNTPAEREVVVDDDGGTFYGTDIYEVWKIEDYDNDVYYVSLVSDTDLTEEVE